MTEIPILDDRAVSEIEAQSQRFLSHLTFGEPTRGNRYVQSIDAGFYFEENADAEFDAFVLIRHLPALCATVKHLRARLDSIKSKTAWHRDGIGPDVPVMQERYDNLIAQRNDLQSRLEQLRAENERLKQHVVDLNHDLECAIKECNEHSNY